MSGLSSFSSAWSQIAALGEKLLATPQLDGQRDLIVTAASSLLKAEASLWLDERLFRLPGLNRVHLFPDWPDDVSMQRVLENPENCPESENVLVLPLSSQQTLLGVLLVRRPDGPPFTSPEYELFQGLAAHTALALMSSHRFAIEKWRLEQLTLVRTVSAQLANVLDLSVLTQRVTRLICDTFKYYYVAIFTLEENKPYLQFQSSAGGPGQPRLRLTRIKPGQGLIGAVAQTGEEIIANNVAEEPRYRYLTSLPGTRSEVVLPLKIESRLLGVLDIQSDQEDAFHPNDLLVLRSLADVIATAINRTRLYSDLQRRIEQLAMIATVSESIASVLDLDELFNKVATLIHERLGYPYVYLFTVHPNRRQIIYQAGSGARTEFLKGYTISLDSVEGMIPWAARTGETILANDVRLEPRYRPSPFPPDDTRSELTIPLLYDNKPVGVLDLQSNRRNAFSEEDRFVLEALAANIAVAIHNADLFRTERWRRQVADSLREVAGRLSAQVSVDDVLDSVLRELERNLPCDASGVWLMDGDSLYPAHIHGADVIDVQAAMLRWPEVVQTLLEIMDTDEPIIRKPTDPFGPLGLALGFSADYSSIGVALRVADRPLGVLVLSHHTPGRYGHEAQAITATFASYASVAIENARLYDSAQEQAYASAALLQVAQAISQAENLKQAVQAIVRIMPILVGVKACAVYLWENGAFRPAGDYGFSQPVRELLCNKDLAAQEHPLLQAVLQTNRMSVSVLPQDMPQNWLDPVLARNEQEEYYLLQTAEHLLIGFPLLIKNAFYGVMLVEESGDSRRFRQKRIEIANSIAQQVALSVQNEQLQREMVARERLEHEVQLARQIQRTFLPQSLPHFSDWELAAVWRTARQVGGDFYDVFELPNRRLGLFIADVSDKGIPAALFMALTRTLVRSAVVDDPSPAAVMRRVNELIIPDNHQGMFVTAVYAVLSLDTGALTFVNAGHNPPIWFCPASGKLERLHRTAPALGIIENPEIQEQSIRLENGDLFLLYTDGVTEAFSPQDELFGDERLEEVVRSSAAVGVNDLLRILQEKVDAFMESLPPSDDLTILAIKRTPSIR
jgi:serine phosphatase RsbU (regulator of sigma subunit)/putative methionine-R-sulfoxide reductase with GAF domain